MNNRAGWLYLPLVLAVALPVTAAEPSHTDITETTTGSAIIAEQPLTPTELARSQAWELMPSEWRRYQALMQGVRGSISPQTLSPIEVLGIHARDDNERRRYAERWAQVMHEDAERILAFQRAYDEAGRRLYPNTPLIDASRLQHKTETSQLLEKGDRVLFFTRPDCPACDALLKRLLKHLHQVAGIDIYLNGVAPGDDQAVRDWAEQQGIDPEWVRSHGITLNHGAQLLARLTEGKGEIPSLMRRRGLALTVIRASAL